MLPRSARSFGCLCLFLLSLLSCFGAESGGQSPRTFDVPAGDAVDTIKLAARQGGIEIVFLAETVRGLRTHAVRGSLKPQEAMERLLASTGLVIVPDQAHQLWFVQKAAPSASGSPPSLSPSSAQTPSMQRKTPLAVIGSWLALAFAAGHPAHAADTGAITGRIYNPATGDYLRNAEVRVVGGPTAASEDGGVYRLPDIKAGDATVTVEYTGYRSASATVRVIAGQTVTRDFELTSAAQSLAADGTVKLGAFVVSSAREGNAKAIMEQRQSMNITNSVSSDVFGDVAEGNVGEFLKHLPGVDYDALDGTVRYVSLRGLSSEYAGVTVDGMTFPSADAGQTTRAFSFEQVSLSAMESIEVSKTISADVDASSPAGTINLKTKRAFDRAGRRVSASFSLTGQSNQFDLGKTYGPGDDASRKLFPSAQLEYSDIFLNKRLGIVIGVSESNSYLQRAPTTMGYNYAATAASPQPAVITAIRAQLIHQTIERFATSFTADYKATPHLVLSLNVMYNHSDVWSGQRSVVFNTNARATPVSGDPLTNFSLTGNGSVTVEPQGVAKIGNGKSYSPRFEYTRGDLTIEGRGAISDSISEYDPMEFRDSIFSPGVLTLNNVRFQATRSALHRGDWTFQQTAGGDWSDGALYTTPAITLNDGRYTKSQLYTGEGIVTYRTRRILPVVWKTGAKWKREVRDYRNARSASLYNYTGPGAGVGAWRNHGSALQLDYSEQDLYIRSLSGQRAFLPSIKAIGQTFREHPEYFTPSMSGTDFYNAYVANTRHYEEDISALFLMGTTKIGNLNLRAGVRYEETETDAREFDARSSREVTAAGFPVSAGRATTIPGVEYQFLSLPRIHRRGEYDHLFPSASLKYNITRTLDLQLGYSSTVKRPQFANIAGVWIINDDTMTVNAPNVNLKPEESDNFSLRLAQYFEPVGTVAINFFQNNIKGLHLANTRISGDEFYPDDPTYGGYTFITTTQSKNNVRVRGMEFEYSQSLSFLPGLLKGLGVRASYTRNYAQITVADMSPHLVAAGLSYSHHRLNLYANMNWAASRPIVDDGSVYQRHRINIDVGGSYRFERRLSAFFSVRNILNEPFIRMEKMGNSPAVARFYQKFGVTPTVGVKTTF